ncbi:hypothetical protein IMCC3317_28560 [Kordia antarctica]|uniref:Uncharacterized protein n=1 Tax=Kordia antarctica TaxID=1218801 RepID=A0A7L4ZLV5_9FLAO|nr:hypothetical protein [Kordia antarctica]QHI37477.1 hypothetical protein IMCC3317_28560 [Kordia antarctica]
MKKILGILFALCIFGCNETKKANTELETSPKLKTQENVNQDELPYKIDFDSTKVAKFTIEHSELVKSKALDKILSDYTTQELKELPEFKRLTLGIVVPFDISKESLLNTMKYITSEKIKENKDIDEIMIFAYDDKKDLTNSGGIYTFGKLFWGPNGKTGNVTSKIAKNNNRDSYKFDIDIKDKVGNIKKTDLPTKRELDIYNEMMNEKYIDLQEEEYHPLIMKKFNIKTKKELDAIWLKVAAYKY